MVVVGVVVLVLVVVSGWVVTCRSIHLQQRSRAVSSHVGGDAWVLERLSSNELSLLLPIAVGNEAGASASALPDILWGSFKLVVP